MKNPHILILALLLTLSIPYAGAQSAAKAPAPEAKSSANAAILTQGVVKKIDLATQRITLQHGEIKNLGMPAMTMVFRAKDPSVLSKLKVGDAVRFHAEEADGGLLVTRIEKASP